jgi:hypothetical protein
MILSARSFPQLRATFQEYAKIANKDIDDTIQSEMSGDLKNSMLTIGIVKHFIVTNTCNPQIINRI